MGSTQGKSKAADAYAEQQEDIARDLLRVRGELIAHTALASATEKIGEMLVEELQKKADGVDVDKGESVLAAEAKEVSWVIAKLADENVVADTDDELRLSSRSMKKALEAARAGSPPKETARQFIPEVEVAKAGKPRSWLSSSPRSFGP